MSTRVTPSSWSLSLAAACALAACGGAGPAGPTSTPAGTTAPTSSGTAPVVHAVSPASGPEAGGNLVTISGLNFGARPQVLFGSQVALPAAAPAATATSITVIAPKENAGLISVVVTNQDGQYVVAPLAYRYVGAGGG